MTWVDNDLTKFAGGTPAANGSALDGYSQGDSSQHINFIDGTGTSTSCTGARIRRPSGWTTT